MTIRTDKEIGFKIPILSLFSGGGFLDLGFMNMGFQVEKALEINEQFIYGYNEALQEYSRRTSNTFWTSGLISHRKISDATDLSNKKHQVKIIAEFNTITGIIGGPPCQDYSVGGKNKGVTGDRGRLIYSYLALVKQIRPDFLFFENVEGLYKNKRHQESFKNLTLALNRAGYKLWFDVINPLSYGFPQDRPRVIVVGFKKSLVRRLVQNGYRDTSNDIGLLSAGEGESVFRFPQPLLHNPKQVDWPGQWDFGSEIIQHDLDLIPREYVCLQVAHAFNEIDDLPNQNEHFNAKSKKFGYIAEGDTKRKSFKRLHRFRYSPTVAYGNNEVHLHPTKERRLTVREALRLQTVPDEYVLPSDLTLTAKFKMISNGVPTSMAELIAKEIRRTLTNYVACK